MSLPTNMGTSVKGITTVKGWAEATDLDWTAKQVPLIYQFGDEVIDSSRSAIVRSDNGSELGVLSNSYKAVQPEDILKSFKTSSEKFGFDIERIGSHNNGKVIWGRSLMSNSSFKGSDDVNYYLYVASSLDGTLATTMFLSTERVVCLNAINVQFNKETENSIKWYHRTAIDHSDISSQLDIWMDKKRTFDDNIQKLIDFEMPKKAQTNFLNSLMFPNVAVGELSNRQEKKVDRYLEAAMTSPGSNLASVRTKTGNLTGWGMLNGITYMTDHVLGRGSDNHNRSIMFGAQSKTKINAMNDLIELAEVA